MSQRELPQALWRGETEAVLWQRMRPRNEMARAQDLRSHDIDERVPDPEREQAGVRRLDEPVIRKRAGASHIQVLERHMQPGGQRPHIIVFGDVPGGDQHAIGTDIERNRAPFSGRERTLRQPAAQAVEFRALGPRAALCGSVIRLGSGT